MRVEKASLAQDPVEPPDRPNGGHPERLPADFLDSGLVDRRVRERERPSYVPQERRAPGPRFQESHGNVRSSDRKG